MLIKRPIHRKSFARRPRANSQHRCEPGFVIILVAVFLLFVVGAMAALSIDVVTFYTARSEAQLAADAAALAGARVLANSGATSYSDATMLGNAQALAGPVATQVAMSNSVGGRNLLSTEVTVNFNGNNSPCAAPLQVSNPCVTVTVTRTDLPVFFARIWGSTQVTIAATATAEAYNPSGLAAGTSGSPAVPIAPSCVKPWVLPNIDPTSSTSPPAQIFDPTTGAILNSGLLGMSFPNAANAGPRLFSRCGGGPDAKTADCTVNSSPGAWQYYVGDDLSFPHPAQALPVCALGMNSFQTSIAGCVQTPIACGNAPPPPASQITVDTISDTTLDAQAAAAVDCLTHSSTNKGDTIGLAVTPPTAFEFTAGDDNPLVAGTLASGATIVVSDSLVTLPVYNNPDTTGNVSNPVTVIGFLQLFLEPTGRRVPGFGPHINEIRTKIINMVGCGTNSNVSPPIYGNGSSAVPVRLISHP